MSTRLYKHFATMAFVYAMSAMGSDPYYDMGSCDNP